MFTEARRRARHVPGAFGDRKVKEAEVLLWWKDRHDPNNDTPSARRAVRRAGGEARFTASSSPAGELGEFTHMKR